VAFFLSLGQKKHITGQNEPNRQESNKKGDH